MNARDHFQAGQLAEAIAAVTADVKQAPLDSNHRGFLCELLSFAGEYDRADKQLKTLGEMEPASMLGVNLFRQLIRAEEARQQFYSDGRLPEFLQEPGPVLKLHLEASIRLREGQKQEAVELLRQAEEQRAKVSGTCDGQPFNDLRDLDDLTASFFEVLTSTGKYYWVAFDGVESLEFRPPARARDLLWRPARLIVRGGPDGEVFLPTLYAGSQAETDAALRRGRATDWRGGTGEPTRGVGLRTFLMGDDSRPILEIHELTIGEK